MIRIETNEQREDSNSKSGSNLTYHIWTIGCQMNEADSRNLNAQLHALGLKAVADVNNADIVVLNSCVVRQRAEDKVYGKLGVLRKLKHSRPEMMVALMGCLVGVKPRPGLMKRFPFVDVFLAPSDVDGLVHFLVETGRIEQPEREKYAQCCLKDIANVESSVTAFVPVVLGCSHACAFCVIPSRRGPERSRPRNDILAEVHALAANGIREVTLLGQIVDRYGLDLPGKTDLASLLESVALVEGLKRVRFLTSHPNWFGDRLLKVIADNDKVCPQIEIAVQSGNDQVLERMRRGYVISEFCELISRIREEVPEAAIHTDIIVGFPGETEAQFMDTFRLLEEMRFDKVHIACYSERPGTPAANNYDDDVPLAEKQRRQQMLETLQRNIQKEKNGALQGADVEVLVETRNRGRWMGRTPRNKIVYFEAGNIAAGDLVNVKVDWAGPFSLVGKICG